MELRIKSSTILKRIYDAQTRVIVNEGSSRSTKTFSILQYLILRCVTSPVKVTATRQKLTWLKATVIPDFKEVMQTQFKEWDEEAWNKSESIYRFPNGSEFAFVGIDEHQKLHGRKQDYAWVNEAVEIEKPEFTQLALRTTRQLILDYNPAFESHWIYDQVIPRDDCTLIKSTYKDNPFLLDEIKQEIERLEPTPANLAQGTADEISWKIYGLGERAAHKGLIFQKAQIVKALPPPSEWKREFYGLDFGFTNDPSALVHIVLSQGDLYFRQLFYRRGLTNIINPNNPTQPSIEKYLKDLGVSKKARVWADSAEPKSIADLNGSGWSNVKAVMKGPDSVKAGIDIMLRYNLFITEDSVDMIKEKNNYKWKEDRLGNATNEPTDAFNHCFVGETLIQTTLGPIKIKDVKINDQVMTSLGPKKVLNSWCSGLKEVYRFELITKSGIITLECTPNHLIKTQNGWIPMINLEQGDVIYLCKNSLEGSTDSIQRKDIFRVDEIGCIELSGSTLMAQFPMAIISTIKTKTRIIMRSKIWKLLKRPFICLSMEETQKSFHFFVRQWPRRMKRLKNGMDQRRDESGIDIMANSLGKIVLIVKKNVFSVILNIKRGIRVFRGFAQIPAKRLFVGPVAWTMRPLIAQFAKNNLKPLDSSHKKLVLQSVVIKVYRSPKGLHPVYDLTVEDAHEFFANGLLVHNCWDAARYGCFMELNPRSNLNWQPVSITSPSKWGVV